MKVITLSLLGMLIGSSNFGPHPELAHFPNPANVATAPDRQATVISEDREMEPNHALYLSDHASKRLLTYYRRHVDVLWSPDSRYIFINDYLGSNSSDCIVVDRASLEKVSLNDAVPETLRKSFVRDAGGHFYVTCEGWKAPRSVSIRVRGYNGSPIERINEVFVYDVSARRLNSTK